MISVTSAHASGIFNKKAASGGEELTKQDAVQTAEISAAEYKTVRITGIVRLVGSEPFSELVITGNLITEQSEDSALAATWYIASNERNKLNNLQYSTVTVEGDESIRELTFASGIPAGIRRELRNIRIISIE